MAAHADNCEGLITYVLAQLYRVELPQLGCDEVEPRYLAPVTLAARAESDAVAGSEVRPHGSRPGH